MMKSLKHSVNSASLLDPVANPVPLIPQILTNTSHPYIPVMVTELLSCLASFSDIVPPQPACSVAPISQQMHVTSAEYPPVFYNVFSGTEKKKKTLLNFAMFTFIFGISLVFTLN